MQQLLESIGKISQATSDKAKIHFESHVFLDGAVRGDELTEFALQLISLLKDALSEWRKKKRERERENKMFRK